MQVASLGLLLKPATQRTRREHTVLLGWWLLWCAIWFTVGMAVKVAWGSWASWGSFDSLPILAMTIFPTGLLLWWLSTLGNPWLELAVVWPIYGAMSVFFANVFPTAEEYYPVSLYPLAAAVTGGVVLFSSTTHPPREMKLGVLRLFSSFERVLLFSVGLLLTILGLVMLAFQIRSGRWRDGFGWGMTLLLGCLGMMCLVIAYRGNRKEISRWVWDFLSRFH